MHLLGVLHACDESAQNKEGLMSESRFDYGFDLDNKMVWSTNNDAGQLSKLLKKNAVKTHPKRTRGWSLRKDDTVLG